MSNNDGNTPKEALSSMEDNIPAQNNSNDNDITTISYSQLGQSKQGEYTIVRTEEHAAILDDDYILGSSGGGYHGRIAQFRPNWLTVLARVFINIALPFVNGMMLGFGEIFAHNIGLRFKWRGAKVC